MAVYHFVISSIISTCALICYLCLCISVFIDSTQCRHVFESIQTNTTIIPKNLQLNNVSGITLCELSLVGNYRSIGCICRKNMLSPSSDEGVRIFDDTVVAFASLLFIATIIIEFIKFLAIVNISWHDGNVDHIGINDFSINGLYGLLEMISNTNLIEYIRRKNSSLISKNTKWLILQHLLALLVVLLYINASNRSHIYLDVLSIIFIGLSIIQLLFDYRRMNDGIYMSARGQSNLYNVVSTFYGTVSSSPLSLKSISSLPSSPNSTSSLPAFTSLIPLPPPNAPPAYEDIKVTTKLISESCV